MRLNPYVFHGLKYATFTLAAVVLVITGAALMKGANTSSLTGRLVPQQQNGVTPTVHFTADRAIDGFSIPTDSNVIFTVPYGSDIPRVTFLGGPDYDEQHRFWGYCYSGNEAAKKAAGKTGSEMYDGRFFYSTAERKAQGSRLTPAQNDLLGILQNTHGAAPAERISAAEIFHAGETCYIMTSVELPAAMDTDGDALNNKREQLLGTDSRNPDTDRDGIPDGTEVFVTKTSPLQADSDNDGLGDLCEDKNTNGNVDPGETSALNADTDRDTLCDGNGSGSGCPEAKQVVCSMDENGDRLCESKITSPVYGEDMNQNCQVDSGETDPTNAHTFGTKNDFDYKWSLLGGAPQIGRPAPAFPIPELPPYP